MRSRKAGLPFATRARKRELSIQEVRIENDSDQKFSKTTFFKVFLKTTFFHDSCHPDHYEPKIFFRFSKSGSTFDIRFWIRDRDRGFLLVMRSRKAGFPFATRARKRELSIQEVRIENDSDQKVSKTKFFKVFLKTTFFHDSCQPDHYEPKIFFRFSKSGSTLRYTILDSRSRVSPCNAISEGRLPLFNTSSEAGALDTD